ncbi:hypothetical protein HDV01_003923 [Terramyces sp. JEL0728]|nr:hypothetical protein HDV01_003923 [Terramyces sp. JEL0728]
MANRVPCKFFLEGRCKNGNSCKFLHEKSATTKSALDKDSVRTELETERPLWFLSSFGLTKYDVNVIRGTDLSQEEARWNAVMELKSTGQISNYITTINQMNLKMTSELQRVIQNPQLAYNEAHGNTANTQSAFATPTKSAFGQTNTAGLGGQSSFGQTNTAFGQTNTAFGQTGFGNNNTSAFGSTASAFSTPTKTATSAFGGGATAFGGNKAAAFGANTPTFGGNTTKSAFGGNNTTSAFGGNTTSAFGGQNTTSAFGSANNSAFGANTTTTSFGGTNPSAFGSNNTAAFGANNNTPAFGNNNTTSTFGTNNTSGFGTNNTNTAFGTTNSQQNPNSAFGQVGVAQTNTTPAFGQTPTVNTTSVPAQGEQIPPPAANSSMTQEQIAAAFAAPRFEFGQIPEIPPK